MWREGEGKRRYRRKPAKIKPGPGLVPDRSSV